MRQILFSLACLIICASSASAQIASAKPPVPDSGSLAGMREFFDRVGEQYGLPSISKPTSDTLGIELRIWESHGAGNAPGLIMRETNGVWSARRVELRLHNSFLAPEDVAVAGDWGALWVTVQKLGLLDLPHIGGKGGTVFEAPGIQC